MTKELESRIESYIAKQKEEANNFINCYWFPDFIHDFIIRSDIERKLATIHDQKEREKMLMSFGKEIDYRLKKRKKTLLDGIDAVGRGLVIRYGEMK